MAEMQKTGPLFSSPALAKEMSKLPVQAADQPQDQKDNQDQAQRAAKAAAAIGPIAVIAATAADQQNHKNDDEKQ
jgi:hypothetical protein